MSFASLICFTRSSAKVHRALRKISSNPGTLRTVVVMRGWRRRGKTDCSEQARAAESRVREHGGEEMEANAWPGLVVEGPQVGTRPLLLLQNLCYRLLVGKPGVGHVRHSFAVAFCPAVPPARRP